MAIYYVSNASPVGSDAANGTSQATPWLTIAKVNATSFVAGDQILFNRGCTWRETLTVPSSGSAGAGNAITFGAYGSGNTPKILASDAATSWTNAATPAVLADLLSETFDAVGYDNAGWVETVGAGSTLDEDSTTVADSDGGATQILKIVKVSPNWAAWTVKDLGADKPISYSSFRFKVTAEGLTNSNQITVFRAIDTALNTVVEIDLRKSSAGVLNFIMTRFTGGTTTVITSQTVVALNTWYTNQIKYDATNLVWQWKMGVTGGSMVIQGSGSLVAAVSLGIRNIRLGSLGTEAFTLTAYIDKVEIGSAGFPAAAVNPPTQVWHAPMTLDPASVGATASAGGVWFENLDGSITWGHIKEALIGNLSEEFEWSWDSGLLYVYSVTDPTTRYTRVEATQRSSSIEPNGKDYLTFTALDTRYGAVGGINGVATASAERKGLLIQNCYASYIGTKGETVLSYGFNGAYSSTTITGCVVSEIARRGITCTCGTAASTISGVAWTDNTVYNTYHSALDVQISGTAVVSNIEIARNYCYQDPTNDLVNPERWIMQFMLSEGNAGSQVSGVVSHHNKYRNCSDKAEMYKFTSNFQSYNNTFYGAHPNQTLSGAHLWVFSTCAGTNRIKNNIFDSRTSSSVNTLWVGVAVASAALITEMDYNLHYTSDTAVPFFQDLAASNYTTGKFASYRTATGFDAHSPVPTDPLFLDVSTSFALGTNSPAKDTGAVIVGYNDGTLGSTKYSGTAPEIGAYEYNIQDASWVARGTAQGMGATKNKLRVTWVELGNPKDTEVR